MTLFWNESNPLKPTGIKDPNAVLDYPVDFTAWLTDMGATYVSHVATKTGSIVIDSTSHVAGVITTIISGGSVGETASFTLRLTATITGGAQRIDDRTFYLRIVER